MERRQFVQEWFGARADINKVQSMKKIKRNGESQKHRQKINNRMEYKMQPSKPIRSC